MADAAALKSAEIALKRYLRDNPQIEREPFVLTDWVAGYVDAWQAHEQRDPYDVAGAWTTPAGEKSALYKAGYSTYIDSVTQM